MMPPTDGLSIKGLNKATVSSEPLPMGQLEWQSPLTIGCRWKKNSSADDQHCRVNP